METGSKGASDLEIHTLCSFGLVGVVLLLLLSLVSFC